jgi:hypothetical protein
VLAVAEEILTLRVDELDPNMLNKNECAVATERAEPSGALTERLIQDCKDVTQRIQSQLAYILRDYHTLGKILVEANISGKELKKLAEELGKGFSPTTLYQCMSFFRQYPDFEAFRQKHGAPNWRDVSNRILVKRSRTYFNPLKSDQPIEFEFTLELEPFKLSPRVLLWYKTAKKWGYDDDLGSFITECVDGLFGKFGFHLGVLKVIETR